jgi:hypothetical protein
MGMYGCKYKPSDNTNPRTELEQFSGTIGLEFERAKDYISYERQMLWLITHQK